MNTISNSRTTLAVIALMASAVPGIALAQQEVDEGEGRVLTTVYGSAPEDLSGFPEGPDIEGFVSARDGDKVQVTTADGTTTVVTIGQGTEIRAKKGFLGLGRDKLGLDQLLNGVPVQMETVEWGSGLVASKVRLSSGDLETAQMIRNGTSQKFAQQGAAIEENAIATEALRGRFGDIDQYNVKGTTNVYFDTGKHALSAQARNELCATAAQAETTDNALLLVVGYTNSTGSYEVNQELSEKRASRVVNYLQQQCGWKPFRMLTPTGMAASDPAADNSTTYGKAQNRRVAVNVLVSKSVDGL